MMEPDVLDLPLRGIFVVDLVGGPLASLTRYLSELGAEVDRVEPSAAIGDPFEGAAANHGKRRHRAGDDAELASLIAAAHIVVADRTHPIDLGALVRARGDLVAMTVSDFGSNTALSSWAGSGPVLHALSGELARSGIRGRPPLLPPGDLAYQCAASQAAFVLVAALYRALRSGVGEHIDFAALDGAVQALDPGFGIGGSATLGRPAHLLARDRPAKGTQYPILRCADGHVRICLLAKRQWQGMFRWMGEPAQFAAPEFGSLAYRYKSPELLPAIAAFFAAKPRREIEAEAKTFGVPVSAILTFEECIATDHMRERGAIVGATAADGRPLKLPAGMLLIDGRRAGAPQAPSVAARYCGAKEQAPPSARAFDGLKVLDLGVIVVGGEQGRLLADLGADVVKVESRDFPDGNRQSYLTYGMSVSFAAGHRNKRGLGINLRNTEGRALFLELAATADVILSNFKPGTMARLGIDYDTIASVNPRIVMTDSSAFGASGPWSDRMGYGPLVRAATGLTLAWRYPDDPEGWSDSITIYPDHVAARIGALGTIALLIRRLRTGQGGTISVAQSEVMLGHFAADVARSSVGEATGPLPDWPWGVYSTAGDDEWCVVTVTGDVAWRALCGAIGFRGEALLGPVARLAARTSIDAALGGWLANRSARAAADTLQAVGVAAAPMLRLADLPAFAYYQDRAFYRVEAHPYLDEKVTSERRHATGTATVDAPLRPAPLVSEHSREIVTDWLARDAAAVAAYFTAGALEPIDPAEWEEVQTFMDGIAKNSEHA